MYSKRTLVFALVAVILAVMFAVTSARVIKPSPKSACLVNGKVSTLFNDKCYKHCRRGRFGFFRRRSAACKELRKVEKGCCLSRGRKFSIFRRPSKCTVTTDKKVCQWIKKVKAIRPKLVGRPVEPKKKKKKKTVKVQEEAETLSTGCSWSKCMRECNDSYIQCSGRCRPCKNY